MHNLTNITKEFNVIENNTEVIKELCCIAAYYHLMRAVDNSSIIHSKLEQNAHDVLTYWIGLILFSISCIVIVMSQSLSNMSIPTDLVVTFFTCRALPTAVIAM